MTSKLYNFHYDEYQSEQELNDADLLLLQKAREATKRAYAPYSGFLVGAAALLDIQEIVIGSNHENASFPAGICAERALLASAAQLFPEVAVDSMAITYNDLNGISNTPITPCGFCRQVIAEYEMRFNKMIRLILCGTTGKVQIIHQASMLLPFAFQKNNKV